MKTIYPVLFLLSASISSYGRNFYTFTAKQNGNWDYAGTWNMVVRNDNVQKDKFIIPAGIAVTGNEDVNSMGFNDVEIMISGVLKLGASVSLHFGTNSKIEVLETGSITASGASQQIYIGSVMKYTGSKNKVLNGPLYADFTTGKAPEGFAAYAVPKFSFLHFSAVINNRIASLNWSSSNDQDNSVYQIEQRINENEWLNIGVVKATGNTGGVKAYTFENKNVPSGLVSYRLKQVDADGMSQYSNTVSINQHESNPSVNILSSKKISVEFAGEVKNTVDVKIMNLNGHMMSSQSFTNPSSRLIINLADFKSGDYLVYVSDNLSMETLRKVSIK